MILEALARDRPEAPQLEGERPETDSDRWSAGCRHWGTPHHDVPLGKDGTHVASTHTLLVAPSPCYTILTRSSVAGRTLQQRPLQPKSRA